MSHLIDLVIMHHICHLLFPEKKALGGYDLGDCRHCNTRGVSQLDLKD